MFSSRRDRWVTGRHSNVDGIPFRMPVANHPSPTMMAVYSIDAEAAQDMLPEQELHVVRVGGRGLLVISVVDYKDTVIGNYVEFSIGIPCTRRYRPAAPLWPLLFSRGFGLGLYIHDLPVSTEISVKGGLGIWGMPKHQANLDFVIGDSTVSSQYDLDGKLVVRLDIPRPTNIRVPMWFSGTVYGGDYRGLLTKSSVRFQGRVGLCFRPHARLLIGDHERATTLKQLDIDYIPWLTAFLPAMTGVLDDHVESWFLTFDDAPAPPRVGMRDVVDLGLSQEWLAPPDREYSDRLLAAQPMPPRWAEVRP